MNRIILGALILVAATLADDDSRKEYAAKAASIEKGDAGAQGIQGVDGTTGAQGIQGVDGTTGAQGIQGVDGTTGAQGIQGVDGTTGAQGIQGVDGTTGSYANLAAECDRYKALARRGTSGREALESAFTYRSLSDKNCCRIPNYGFGKSIYNDAQ